MTGPSGSAMRAASLLRLIAVGGGRGSRAARGSITGALSRLLAAAGSLITIPLLLGYLGTEQYGLWVTVATTISWISLTQLGVQPSMLNRLARTDHADASGREALVSTAWWASVALTVVGAGLLVLLDVAGAWPALYNAHGDLGEVARTFAIVMWLALSTSLLLLVPAHVLRADQEVSKANLVEAGGTIARVAAVVALIVADLGTTWLVIGAFFAPVLVSGAAGLRVFWSRHLWPRPAAFRRSILRPLITTGLGFLGIATATLLVTSTDALIVAQLLGLSAVPTYSVAFALLVVMIGIQIAVADALWPAYAEAGSINDVHWIRRVHRQATLALASASALFGIGLVLVGRPVIEAWAGPSAVPPLGLLVAFGLIAVLSAIEATHNRLLVALGRVRLVTVVLLGGALANVPLSILLGSWFGVTGVAAGTVITYAVTCIGLAASARQVVASSEAEGAT